MGTNYYAVRKRPSLYDREIHIGKSSVGWLFLFHDNEYFHTYPQFKEWVEKNVPKEYILFDEYEREISKKDLFNLIDDKQNDEHNLSNPENFDYGIKNIDGYRFTDRDFS